LSFFLDSKHKNEATDSTQNKTNLNCQNSITKSNIQNINASCINALRFDTNSNNSFDELITINGIGDLINTPVTENTENSNNSSSNVIKPNTPTNRTKTPTRVNRVNKTPTNDLDISNKTLNSTSPPPPPSIGTLPLINAQSSAPSPTKLPQFYPYTGSSGHIMHRPIPILQKADATLSSLINNLTTSPSLSRIRSSPTTTSQSPQNLNPESKSIRSSKNNISNSSQANSNIAGKGQSKTPSADQMNELIKINQQQQLISSLRSSLNNNSPLMFNMGFNNCTSANNSSANNNNFNNSNVKIFIL